MKKLLLIGGAVLTLAAVGCKKDYTCDCTYDAGTLGTQTASYTVKDTKKNAEEWCEGNQTTITVGAQSYTWSCTLK
ncbi:MAG: hypothetical protein MRY83_01815 [Flavobacteriales bacterium]|nr:hypothetical protein [Flavobacteriales bacterium]